MVLPYIKWSDITMCLMKHILKKNNDEYILTDKGCKYLGLSRTSNTWYTIINMEKI